MSRPRLEIDAEAVALYRSGLTSREVARRLGVGQGTVARRVREAGMARPRGVKPKLPPASALRMMIARGQTQAAIAREYGVTKQAVNFRLRAAEAEE